MLAEQLMIEADHRGGQRADARLDKDMRRLDDPLPGSYRASLSIVE